MIARPAEPPKRYISRVVIATWDTEFRDNLLQFLDAYPRVEPHSTVISVLAAGESLPDDFLNYICTAPPKPGQAIVNGQTGAPGRAQTPASDSDVTEDHPDAK